MIIDELVDHIPWSAQYKWNVDHIRSVLINFPISAVQIFPDEQMDHTYFSISTVWMNWLIIFLDPQYMDEQADYISRSTVYGWTDWTYFSIHSIRMNRLNIFFDPQYTDEQVDYISRSTVGYTDEQVEHSFRSTVYGWTDWSYFLISSVRMKWLNIFPDFIESENLDETIQLSFQRRTSTVRTIRSDVDAVSTITGSN